MKTVRNCSVQRGCYGDEDKSMPLSDIRDKKYKELLIKDGMRTIHRYGIACYKKSCKVKPGTKAAEELYKINKKK